MSPTHVGGSDESSGDLRVRRRRGEQLIEAAEREIGLVPTGRRPRALLPTARRSWSR